IAPSFSSASGASGTHLVMLTDYTGSIDYDWTASDIIWDLNGCKCTVTSISAASRTLTFIDSGGKDTGRVVLTSNGITTSDGGVIRAESENLFDLGSSGCITVLVDGYYELRCMNIGDTSSGAPGFTVSLPAENRGAPQKKQGETA
ncbi:MAG: hypothetical protein K2N78_04960, partial [Oscillospiraceae bacterium]|nr:hypothetical protein [Oscillospiraceae bacterium]